MRRPIATRNASVDAGLNPFVAGDAFIHWKNQLFVSSLNGQDVRRLVIAKGRVAHEEVVLKGAGRVRAIVNGPDSYLYVVLNNPDGVARIVPASPSAR